MSTFLLLQGCYFLLVLYKNKTNKLNFNEHVDFYSCLKIIPLHELEDLISFNYQSTVNIVAHCNDFIYVHNGTKRSRNKKKQEKETLQIGISNCHKNASRDQIDYHQI